jgi:hypothetical protein
VLTQCIHPPCVHPVHHDPSIALLYLLCYSTAELPFVVDIQGKPHHRPRRTLRPTDRNNGDVSGRERGEGEAVARISHGGEGEGVLGGGGSELAGMRSGGWADGKGGNVRGGGMSRHAVGTQSRGQSGDVSEWLGAGGDDVAWACNRSDCDLDGIDGRSRHGDGWGCRGTTTEGEGELAFLSMGGSGGSWDSTELAGVGSGGRGSSGGGRLEDERELSRSCNSDASGREGGEGEVAAG